jgi:hypothetical protein
MNNLLKVLKIKSVLSVYFEDGLVRIFKISVFIEASKDFNFHFLHNKAPKKC